MLLYFGYQRFFSNPMRTRDRCTWEVVRRRPKAEGSKTLQPEPETAQERYPGTQGNSSLAAV